MIHAKATCPLCKDVIYELEDDWFYCDHCKKSFWLWELAKLGVIPTYD